MTTLKDQILAELDEEEGKRFEKLLELPATEREIDSAVDELMSDREIRHHPRRGYLIRTEPAVSINDEERLREIIRDEQQQVVELQSGT
jgi:hypothetical protein